MFPKYGNFFASMVTKIGCVRLSNNRRVDLLTGDCGVASGLWFRLKYLNDILKVSRAEVNVAWFTRLG